MIFGEWYWRSLNPVGFLGGRLSSSPPPPLGLLLLLPSPEWFEVYAFCGTAWFMCPPPNIICEVDREICAIGSSEKERRLSSHRSKPAKISSAYLLASGQDSVVLPFHLTSGGRAGMTESKGSLKIWPKPSCGDGLSDKPWGDSIPWSGQWKISQRLGCLCSSMAA